MLDRTNVIAKSRCRPSDQPPGPHDVRNPEGACPGDNSPQGASEAIDFAPKGQRTNASLDSSGLLAGGEGQKSCENPFGPALPKERASAQGVGHRRFANQYLDADTRPHPAQDGGEGQARLRAQTMSLTPDLQPSASAGETASVRSQATRSPQSPKSPRKGRIGHYRDETHLIGADATIPAAHDALRPGSSSQQDEAVIEGQAVSETQPVAALDDRRFTDPLIAEIVETWRQRQDMVRAQSKLTLQIKAICRRFTEGDKKEADKVYALISKGADHPASLACAALFAARVPLEEARKGYEKHLTKLGKQLPIAHMADSIKGVGHLSIAKIVGECGDLSAYKSVAAVWKRAGLAVINGERQRKVAGDAALLHGYSPQRRSTLWNIADPMLKAQGKDENAGPYRLLYDVHKAAQVEKGCSLIHAHNRAMRYMTKALLKDLTLEWRRIARDPAEMPEPVGPNVDDTHQPTADRRIFKEAAE